MKNLVDNSGIIPTHRNDKVHVVKKWIRKLDMYGRPVTMTYKGKDKFRSILGGFTSMLILACILSFFLYKLRDLILRDQTSIKKNTLVSISNTYSPPSSLSEKNITIAFMLSDYFGDASLDDPRYGQFIFT